jgi:hypothetical protein
MVLMSKQNHHARTIGKTIKLSDEEFQAVQERHREQGGELELATYLRRVLMHAIMNGAQVELSPERELLAEALVVLIGGLSDRSFEEAAELVHEYFLNGYARKALNDAACSGPDQI